MMIAVFCWMCAAVQAVETIIVGEVVNETTGEAIPNVNIHFRGTKIGTTSDENGAYALRVDMQEKCQLVFSAVGYYTQRFDVEPGSMAGLQVAMRERTSTLTEVVVLPNENPALEVLRQVRAHRAENDRTLHPEQTSTLCREQTLYVSHISKKHLRRALWKSLQEGMISQEDSTYVLPLYRETQSFLLSGNTLTPANDQQTQALILSPTDYSAFLGGEGNMNFYANSVSIMGHAFLSPLASSGNLYYRYYIDESQKSEVESQKVRGNECVIVFRTRNPFYATFNGEMVIDTTTFALRSLSAYVPAEVSVNYVNALHLSQTLGPDGMITDERLSVLLDFAVKGEQAGTVFPTLLLTTRMGERENLKDPSYQSDPRDQSDPRNPNYPNYQNYTMEASDSAFMALDSLPLIRTAKWFATIATTGYIPTGTPVDIGHVQEILQVNQHECVHVGLPFRTNERFSKVVSLEASVGYGFRDRSFKGLGRVSVNLPTVRKNTLQFEYNDRYIWSESDDFDRLLRENSMGYGNFDFTSYAFEALHRDTFCRNTALRQRQLQFHWFADWTPNVETHAYVRAGWMPGGMTAGGVQRPTGDISYQTFSAIARVSWGERKYDGFFMRRYAYSNRYPVLFFGLEAGHAMYETPPATLSKGEGGSQVWAHMRVMVTQHANLGMGGTLTYALQAGAIFGNAPDVFLWHADANQGYAYDPYRFTLLHGGEMSADKYAALQAEWNGMGILFNLIPGVRWLHLRELVEAKVAYGYLSSQKSKVESRKPEVESQKPEVESRKQSGLYAEVGVGIGNILRVCDLYSVWALVPTGSSLSPQQAKSAMWALRFRIHIGL